MAIELDGAVTVVTVSDLSEELKSHIRIHLAALCHGAPTVAEAPSFYSYADTLAEFLARYDRKASTMKLGMMGELLTHLLTLEAYPELQNFAIYFNKEERHIKKGFDLTFYDEATSTIWYSEVKSGELQEHDLHDKAKGLIDNATTDLSEKLGTSDRSSLWLSALIDAGLTLSGPTRVKAKELLRNDSTAASASSLGPQNVLLSAVLFHPVIPHSLEISKMVERFPSGAVSPAFSVSKVLLVQKSTIAKIEAFLRAEAVI